MIKPLLILFSALLLLPNLPGVQLNSSANFYNGKEKFSPQLSFINSIEKLEKYVDAAAKESKFSIGTLEYTELLDNTMANRFYNGYTHKTLQQDWISVLTDKIAGTHYSLLLSVDDIMKHPNASPVQQNLVMKEMLKRKNIQFRDININEHDAIEVQLGSNWYFFDVSNEPVITGMERISGNSGIYTSNLSGYYGPLSKTYSIAGASLQHIERGAVNSSSFTGITILQSITGVISKIAWLACLLMLWVVRKRPFKMYAIKPKGKYVRMYPIQPVYNA